MVNLSTAESRKPIVASSALFAFSRRGFHGTTVADVAHESRISPAYVFKLFPSKERLFVAALEDCFDRIVETLGDAADRSAGQGPDAVLDAMGGAYAELIRDRTLLLLQVHAQSVANIPEVQHALRAGLARVTELAKTRSGGSDDAVQRFIAYGQLCHLIVSLGLEDLPEEWATIVAHGIRHPA